MPDTFTFQQFHFLIQEVFGWENVHLYSFSEEVYGGSFRISEPGEMDDCYSIPTKDASKVKLRAYFENDTSKSLVYWYDPRCLAGKGTCPPEDCGGVGGYEYLKALFREDPESEEAQDMREWLGLEEDETWDANYFNLEEANRYLSQL